MSWCILEWRLKDSVTWVIHLVQITCEREKNGSVQFCVRHASLKFLWVVFPWPRPSHPTAVFCWSYSCCIQWGRMNSFEKMVLFQGKVWGLNLGECLSLGSSILCVFSFDIFFTLSNLSVPVFIAIFPHLTLSSEIRRYNFRPFPAIQPSFLYLQYLLLFS